MVKQLDQYLTEVQHTSADMAPTNAILETEVDYLVDSCCGGFFYAHQHHRLTWSVFFLRDAFCVLADAVAFSSHLKCACVSEIESESCCVLVALLCEN